MWGTTLPDVRCSFILTFQTIILIVHICLVQAIRLPRERAERAKVNFYKALWVSVTGALPLPGGGRPGLSGGGGGCEQAWTVAEPEGLWGELQSLRIRKVRISEFRLHFCFQMCHFQSKPLMHMCFWLRTGDPGVAQELSCSFQCLSQRKGRILPLGGGGRRER